MKANHYISGYTNDTGRRVIYQRLFASEQQARAAFRGLRDQHENDSLAGTYQLVVSNYAIACLRCEQNRTDWLSA